MEIYINDALAYYSNSEGKSAGEQNLDIPQYILKSGKQSIRVKIFPLLDKNKNFEKFVSKDAQLTLRIVHGEYEDMKNWKNFKEVFRVQLPKVTIDIPYIELKGEFEAVVPYELEGWSNGVDLSKEDPKKLEEEVLGRLKEIATLYETKSIEGLAIEQYKYLSEYDQAMYNNKIENSDEWEKMTKSSLDESIKTELLNEKMRIMGKGKVVTVLIENGADKNEGIIRNETKEEYLFYAKYFYRHTVSSCNRKPSPCITPRILPWLWRTSPSKGVITLAFQLNFGHFFFLMDIHIYRKKKLCGEYYELSPQLCGNINQ